MILNTDGILFCIYFIDKNSFVAKKDDSLKDELPNSDILSELIVAAFFLFQIFSSFMYTVFIDCSFFSFKVNLKSICLILPFSTWYGFEMGNCIGR